MLADVERRRIPLADAGVEIAVLDWGGSGPLALLHHANGFCAAVWTPVAEKLRERFRVVAMDARGHGDSDAPVGADAYAWENFGRDLGAVARTLAAESPTGRVALGIGHSFGGTATLAAAANHPDLFERLLLLDPVIHLRPDSPLAFQAVRRGQPLADQARKRRAIWPSRDAARERWSGKELFADWDPRVFDVFLAEGMRDLPDGEVELKCSPEVEATVFETGSGFDPWELAPRVKAPTRIVRAARSNFLMATYDELALLMADASVGEVDAGHLIPMERPDLVIEEVEAFVGAVD